MGNYSYLLWSLAILLLGGHNIKLSNSLLLHGYITTLLSDPNHIASALGVAANGAVIESASATDRGTKKWKAAFPEEKSLLSKTETAVRVFD
jgi:hypothetical protein